MIPLLQVTGLMRNFGGLRAVSDLSFDIHEGEIVGLIGPNGAGKTTAFNLISGVLKPTSGHVAFKGRSIVGLRPSTIVKLGLVRTFQASATFAQSSVYENVVRGALVRNGVGFWAGVLNTQAARMAEQRAGQRADELIELMSLQSYRNSTAGALSYGHQRRLGVAIALATKPELLMLDEPVAGLNPEEAVEFEHLIRRIAARQKVSILLVEHHMRLVMSLCGRLVVLNHGEKIAQGSPTEIQVNKEVIDAYLGTPEILDDAAAS